MEHIQGRGRNRKEGTGFRCRGGHLGLRKRGGGGIGKGGGSGEEKARGVWGPEKIRVCIPVSVEGKGKGGGFFLRHVNHK